MKDLYLITGASGGMGKAAATFFAKKGKLLLLDLSLTALEKVKNELKTEIDLLKFDITNEDDIRNVINYVKRNHGFKYLLHFAGVSSSMADALSIYQINLIGTKNLLDALYQYILPNGVIINTSSMAAYLTSPNSDILKLLKDPLNESFLPKILKETGNDQAYNLSKKGVIELTKAEGAKWGLKKARIISISPGAIDTPMLTKERITNQEAIEQLIKQTPLKRVGTTNDINYLISFLISNKASFITGCDILIDGGATEAMLTPL